MRMQAASRLSPIELMLPAGRADRALVLGSACPPRLQPVATSGEDLEPLDLVVVAPTEDEAEQPDWLADAVATCAKRLAADGVVYVLVGSRRRSRTRALLEERGFDIESEVLHLPEAEESRQLVPLDPAASRFAFADVMPLTGWKRIAAFALLRLGGVRLIASRRRGVGLVARRGGGRALFEWLPSPGAPQGGRRSVVVSSSWRPLTTSVVLHPFAADASPPVVAKLSLDAKTGPATEGSRLERLGPAARRAGASVPEPIHDARLDDASVLVMTRVEGEVLARQLMRRPQRLGRSLGEICAWLEAWQRLTATTAQLARGQLEREVLAPAQVLVSKLHDGEDYLSALKARCSALEDTPTSLTDAHNDLTMWNVLVDRHGGLGIIDWEAAEHATLPLKDFFYAVVDAVAAAQRYADRREAVRECFDDTGEHFTTVQALQSSMADAVGVSPRVLDLSFHACWLGHAVNESRTAGPSDPTPFRDIVQWIAQREPNHYESARAS